MYLSGVYDKSSMPLKINNKNSEQYLIILRQDGIKIKCIDYK